MPNPDPRLFQAGQLLGQGRLAEAGGLCRQVLAQAPAHPGALALLGVVEAQSGRKQAALPLMEAAVKADPKNPDARVNLGMLLMELGQADRAVPHLKKAVGLRPNDSAPHFALGNLHAMRRQFGEAEAAFRAVLRLSPGHVNARINLANCLLQDGRPLEAIAQYDEVRARVPDHPLALLGRARASEAAGAVAEAEEFYRRLLAAQPGDVVAANALARLLEELGRTDEAVELFRAAAARPSPVRAEILSNLGCLLLEREHTDEAAAILREAVALKPEPRAVSKLYNLLRSECRWDEAAALEPIYRGLAREGAARIVPYALLLADSTPAEQLAAARAALGQGKPAARPPRGKRKDRLTIGYLSPDFRQHAVAQLVAEVFDLHDPARFRLVAVPTLPPDDSALARRILGRCEAVIDVSGDGDRAAAERLREAGIDLLVDLAGHTRGSRLGILDHRPAPLTASWLGYPGTTGSAAVDYLIADRVLVEPGDREFYGERIVRLPHAYQPNDRQRPRPAAGPARAEMGLPGDGVVFASFVQPNRISRESFDGWMRILAAVPGSVLWLLASGAAEANLRQGAAARGVAPERLVFAGKLPLEAHLARYHLVDLVLDSFPYNAHTTASDALWMGRPFLTRKGGTFAARVGASLLNAVKLPELVACGQGEYEAMAIALAQDPARRAAIRAHLAQGGEALPLFDTPRFTRALESAYGAMWERHLRHQAPDHLDVEDC